MKEIQYPQVQAPVRVAVAASVPTFFDATGAFLFRGKQPQQPPSNTQPTRFFIPTWFECDSVQVFPRRWAQQPNSYVGPVKLIVAAASTRRRQVSVV